MKTKRITEKEFKEIQQREVKNRETFLDLFPEQRKEIEKILVEKEKIVGLLISIASFTFNDGRFCLVEKYETRYVVTFSASDKETTIIHLTYEAFFGFGLLWQALRTGQDSKRFFDLFTDKV